MNHNIKSSLKNVKINKRNNLQNRNSKGAIRRCVKDYLNSLSTFKSSATFENENIVKTSLSVTYSCIDRAYKKKILHKNKVIRNKTLLANIFIKLGKLKI